MHPIWPAARLFSETTAHIRSWSRGPAIAGISLVAAGARLPQRAESELAVMITGTALALMELGSIGSIGKEHHRFSKPDACVPARYTDRAPAESPAALA